MLININFNQQKELDEQICDNLFLILRDINGEIKLCDENIIISCFKKDTVAERRHKLKIKNKIKKLKKLI